MKIFFMLLVVGAALLAKMMLLDDYLTIDRVKEHKEQLLAFIGSHYIQAVLSFMGLFIGTALFLPGALALTVAGGMMFGMVPTAIYANIAATTGAVLAFLAARFVVGGWVQERFKDQLRRFNEELSHRGHNYLLILRILPIAPFLVINYCAGLTKIQLKTFVWTTSLGMLPGSLIYAFIGEQLRYVDAASDLFSWKIMLALLLLALFAVLPVILHHLQRSRK
ncbi:MAG TPA: TVP38/TMEM64 family protein [Geobacter sp.]|nr:TVP38/TMEM64 family protein [Geobacter sp.]